MINSRSKQLLAIGLFGLAVVLGVSTVYQRNYPRQQSAERYAATAIASNPTAISIMGHPITTTLTSVDPDYFEGNDAYRLVYLAQGPRGKFKSFVSVIQKDTAWRIHSLLLIDSNGSPHWIINPDKDDLR